MRMQRREAEMKYEVDVLTARKAVERVVPNDQALWRTHGYQQSG